MNECLACGGANLKQYLYLGDQPLANSFHDNDAPLPEFPLGLNYCTDCFHSQNLVAVEPDLMFKDYPYVSGTTETLRKYFAGFVETVEHDFPIVDTVNEWNGLQRRLKVLDIGCNDGSLLGAFKAHGHIAIGVDPAEHLLKVACVEDRADQTFIGYWDAVTAKVVSAACGPFDVIVAMNVLAHNADPLTFLQLCKSVLAPGGRVYVQTSQALMIANGEFDTVYHEHHSFFTVSSFCALANSAGLHIGAIEHVPIHGTSYLVQLVHPVAGAFYPQVAQNFTLGQDEALLGYYQPGLYKALQERADVTADWVRRTIALCREQGYRVVGYGAAAKAMTFLNFAAIDLDLIIDDNPLKIGKLTPGRNIVVWSIDDIKLNSKPVLFVVLAWNFHDEIVRRIKAVRNKPRDRFLTYFPKVKLE